MSKSLSITIPGRPVPWARARKRKGGGFYTPEKQAAHRTAIANLIQWQMIERGIEPFEGPVSLHVFFDYRANETKIRVEPLNRVDFKGTRPDLDNLVKQVNEALQDSGLVADDGMVASIQAKKVR